MTTYKTDSDAPADIVATREAYERLGGSILKCERVAFHVSAAEKTIFVSELGKEPQDWIIWSGFETFMAMYREWERIKKASEEGGAE